MALMTVRHAAPRCADCVDDDLRCCGANGSVSVDPIPTAMAWAHELASITCRSEREKRRARDVLSGARADMSVAGGARARVRGGREAQGRGGREARRGCARARRESAIGRRASRARCTGGHRQRGRCQRSCTPRSPPLPGRPTCSRRPVRGTGSLHHTAFASSGADGKMGRGIRALIPREILPRPRVNILPRPCECERLINGSSARGARKCTPAARYACGRRGECAARGYRGLAPL